MGEGATLSTSPLADVSPRCAHAPRRPVFCSVMSTGASYPAVSLSPRFPCRGGQSVCCKLRWKRLKAGLVRKFHKQVDALCHVTFSVNSRASLRNLSACCYLQHPPAGVCTPGTPATDVLESLHYRVVMATDWPAGVGTGNYGDAMTATSSNFLSLSGYRRLFSS